MEKFNAQTEAAALHQMMGDALLAEINDGGQIVSGKILDDVSTEFCKLNQVEKEQTVNELRRSGGVIEDGHGNVIGLHFDHSFVGRGGTASLFAYFNCDKQK